MGQLPPAPAPRSRQPRRRFAFLATVALGITALGGALPACNALIGAEDRFLQEDAGGAGDATAPHPRSDGSVDGSGDATVLFDATGDAVVDSGPPLSPYAAAVTVDSPVAWWRMDDPAGSTFAVDELGQHPAAVSGNGAVFGVAGAVGTAMMLGGSGYLDVGDYFDLVPGQGYTMEAWIKCDWQNDQNVLVKRNSDGQGYVLYVHDGPTLQYETEYDDASVGYANEGTEPAVITGFVHVVLTFDPALGVEMYINGVQTPDSDIFNSDAGTPFPITTSLYLGTSVVGELDEVALYDHALNVERVGAHYQAGVRDQ